MKIRRLPAAGVLDEYDASAMHVLHDGPRQVEPLLLIHGTAASVAWWNPVLPALAERHHVIRVDLPGHGGSPPAPSYDVSRQASRVAAVLDDLTARPVVVIGHSSGGYVATALAEQRPDLVSAMALINTGPSLAAFLPRPALVRVLSAPPLDRIAWSLRSDAMIRRALGSAFTREVDIPDDLVAAVRGMTYGAFRTAPRRLSAYLAARALPERLVDLGVPVLVIFGAEDHRWDASSARAYDVVPNARVEMLPGIGHTPMFEAPATTSTLLLDFAATCR
jgi:pimeloyl-ACP methyl ester carboxylesterase